MTYEDLAKEWNSESVFVQCHTSGSTGIPKEIRLPKSQMLKSAERTAEFFSLDSSSFLYSCISPEYIGGKMMYVRHRLLNCGFAWEKPSNKPLKDYRGGTIDLLSIVPSQMIYILENKTRMPYIRNILIGGSAINDLLRADIIKSGLNVYESYGMTETSSHIAIRKVESEDSPFKTLPGITVKEEQNRLKIKIDNWMEFFTNDIAKVYNQNEFSILGRFDNVIISGGKKLYPEAIEAKINKLLDKEISFFITSRNDIKWGEKIILVTDANSSENERIMNICREVLSNYEIPKEIINKTKLEYTANGKLKRNI